MILNTSYYLLVWGSSWRNIGLAFTKQKRLLGETKPLTGLKERTHTLRED